MIANHLDHRMLVLAPNVLGSDGIAAVTRQAIGCWSGEAGGRRVDVWSLLDENGLSQNDDGGVTYRTAGRSRRRFVSWGLRAGLSDQSRTTVLVMHLALAPVALPLVMRGAKLAIFLHGVEAWRRVRRGEALALRHAHLLVANSQHTIRGFKEANPQFAEQPVEVCPLGTELPAAGAVGESDSINGGEHAAPFALIVGRMSSEERYKGHDLLIDLWPSIVNRFPDATLVVAGDGDDRLRLEERSRACGVAERIRFPGRVSDDELRRLYHECAFFAMPSRGEGFGLVFLEAMLAERACLGGIGAAAEIIEHGETGYVDDPTDADAVAEAIIRLFADPVRTAEMGHAGARRVFEHFTADQFRSRLRKLLATLEGCH